MTTNDETTAVHRRPDAAAPDNAAPHPATPPDRLAADPASRFHDAALFARGIGIRFNGVEKTNVEEYCVSEGWIRVAAGKARDRHGRPLLLKLKGTVVPYFADVEPTEATGATEATEATRGGAP